MLVFCYWSNHLFHLRDGINKVDVISESTFFELAANVIKPKLKKIQAPAKTIQLRL